MSGAFEKQYLTEVSDKLTIRIDHLNKIIFGNFLSEIIEGRQKAQEIITVNKKDHAAISKLLAPLAAKEKELFLLAEEQSANSAKYIQEVVRLQSERTDIINKLFFMQKREANNADLQELRGRD